MGGIKQHGNGYQITFHWNGKRYRPTLKIKPTATNLKYAERLKGEIERAIGLGEYTAERYAKDFPTSHLAKATPEGRQIDTFRQIATKWLAASSNLAQGTLNNYRKDLNFWLARIGDMPIDSISYSGLASIANSQGWKPKYRNNMLVPLRQVFEMAYLDEQIATKPTEKIKNSKVQKQPPDPFELNEVDLILDHLQLKYNEQILNYFEFAFFTGCRPEELIALQWSDIDFKAETARIQRVRTASTDRDWTKSSQVRDIELNSRAMAALKRQQPHTYLKDAYVFHNPVTGKRWNSEQAQRKRYWTPSLKTLGLRHRTQYQTRHTFATMNLMAGANPMWVARQMGHATMQMLLTVYSRWIDGADKSQEKNKIEARLKADSHKSATRKTKQA